MYTLRKKSILTLGEVGSAVLKIKVIEMFYIVEEIEELERIKERASNIGAFIHIIPGNSNYHPKLSYTVAVYLRVLDEDQGYIIPVHHSEGLNVGKDRLYECLRAIEILYVVNKKEALYHFNLQNAVDISLLYSMVEFKRLEYSRLNDALSRFYTNYSDVEIVNTIIPIVKLYEYCDDLFKKVESVLTFEKPSGFDFYNRLTTNVFYLLEQSGLRVDVEEYERLYTPKELAYNHADGTVYTSYNLYNTTSRPTNAFNSVNFAALPKTPEHRAVFKPKNDFFAAYDFDGYHLRLLCDQIGYELTSESAHKQLAKYYFGTEDITEEQYLEAKQINFQAIYGKIPPEHRDLTIFVKTQEFIDNMWATYEKAGEVYNPASGKPFTRKIEDLYPAKLMNYMMQSLETSRNVLILKEVLKYLDGKKTKIVLYVYDAVIIDFSEDDGEEILKGIREIMESSGKYPVKVSYAKNLSL
jgi:hypothetical protein